MGRSLPLLPLVTEASQKECHMFPHVLHEANSSLCPLLWGWHRVAALGIGLNWWSAVVCDSVDVRTELEVGGQRLVSGYDLPKVNRRPAHDVSEIRQSGAFRFIVRNVIADGLKQHVPLRLPGPDGFLCRSAGDVVADAFDEFVAISRMATL